MADCHRQPPLEVVLGAPVQIRDEGDVTVIGIRTSEGWRELKRVPDDYK